MKSQKTQDSLALIIFLKEKKIHSGKPANSHKPEFPGFMADQTHPVPESRQHMGCETEDGAIPAHITRQNHEPGRRGLGMIYTKVLATMETSI